MMLMTPEFFLGIAVMAFVALVFTVGIAVSSTRLPVLRIHEPVVLRRGQKRMTYYIVRAEWRPDGTSFIELVDKNTVKKYEK